MQSELDWAEVCEETERAGDIRQCQPGLAASTEDQGSVWPAVLLSNTQETPDNMVSQLLLSDFVFYHCTIRKVDRKTRLMYIFKIHIYPYIQQIYVDIYFINQNCPTKSFNQVSTLIPIHTFILLSLFLLSPELPPLISHNSWQT